MQQCNMANMAAQGRRQSEQRKRRDYTKIFHLPTVPLSTPLAPQPHGLQLPLFDYQRRSLGRMLEIERDGRVNLPLGGLGAEREFCFRGGVVADEVGMGKTAQLIALFLASPREPGTPGSLVITPGHLCAQWYKEIQKFTNQLRVGMIADPSAFGANPAARIQQGCADSDIVITSLEIILAGSGPSSEEIRARMVRSLLLTQPWRRLVYDECHEVIAQSSQAQQDLLEGLAKASKNVWCVSGTPFPHHDDSMYGIHQLLGVNYKMHIVNSPFALNKALSRE